MVNIKLSRSLFPFSFVNFVYYYFFIRYMNTQYLFACMRQFCICTCRYVWNFILWNTIFVVVLVFCSLSFLVAVANVYGLWKLSVNTNFRCLHLYFASLRAWNIICTYVNVTIWFDWKLINIISGGFYSSNHMQYSECVRKSIYDLMLNFKYEMAMKICEKLINIVSIIQQERCFLVLLLFTCRNFFLSINKLLIAYEWLCYMVSK